MSADNFEEWFVVTEQPESGEGYEKQVAKAAWLASRKAALEEAAKVCEEEKYFDGARSPCQIRNNPWECARDIRALIDKP